MSLGLQSLGVIDTFSGWAGGQLDALALPWPALFAGLHLTYFGAHYLFASQTAHVGALYAAFCSLMISAGEPFSMQGLLLKGCEVSASACCIWKMDGILASDVWAAN
jgi:DASS family divalent anion:Na+ symporter